MHGLVYQGSNIVMRRYLISLCLILPAASFSGCSSDPATAALGVAGVTLFGARTPAQEIEQTYYLGIFDPQEQLDPEVYRVRVRGQASILSGMQFGSGWVPASVVDSLGSNISFNENGNIAIEKSGEVLGDGIETGRKLVLFGPEGFRTAPKDHRLVIVMGSSPDEFFNAIDRSLGVVGKAIQEQRNAGLTKLLAGAQSETIQERRRLEEVKRDVEGDLTVQEESSNG